MTTYLSLEEARSRWVDAPLDDAHLEELLEAARVAVADFAPDLGEDDSVPAAYRIAQLMQARNIWNSSKTDPGGSIGDGDFIIRPYPLDKNIRQLLRPKRGLPHVA